MKKLRSPGMVLRVIAALIALLLVALYIGLPTALALAAVAPQPQSAGTPPEGFREVTLTTSDALTLAGWFAEPQNGAVVLLVHGAGAGRESVQPYAAMLAAQGFGVLSLNLRGYGDSEGAINRLGWSSTADIAAAVTFLSAYDPQIVIGGLGISMGGEVLLGAASEIPDLRAIAVDGATYRAVNEYVALPANQPLYRNFTHHVFSTMVSVFTGSAQPQPPLLDSIRSAPDTAFLFIAAGTNDTEVAYNELYHAAVSERSTLWIVPNVGHTGGFAGEPNQYTQTVLEFFTQHLNQADRD